MKSKQHEITSLGALLVVLPIGLVDAAVAMYGWNTFVVRAFDVPEIKLFMTWGLLVFFNYLITKKRDITDNHKTTWEELLSAVLMTLWAWLIMFALHFFI